MRLRRRLGNDDDAAAADTTELFRSAAAAAVNAYAATAGGHPARLAAVTSAHVQALAERGLLAAIPPGVDVPTIEEDAKWLAGQSGHPRFAGDDGWCHLLISDGDVQMAYRHATGRRGGGPRSANSREADVRDRLLRHIAAAR